MKKEEHQGEWRVNIRETETGEVVKTIWCGSERSAEKVESGANINLNHSQFHTEVADHGDFAE